MFSTSAKELEPNVQEKEEDFDRALVESLKNDIFPHLGSSRIPSSLIQHLARTLQEASRLHDFSLTALPSKSDTTDSGQIDRSTVSNEREYSNGTVHPGRSVPREHFAYWCLDLLFSACSATSTS
jgi:hypothetical protein